MTRDDISAAIYRGWARNKNVDAWDELDDLRKAQWEAAADSVIALLVERRFAAIVTDEDRSAAAERRRAG